MKTIITNMWTPGRAVLTGLVVLVLGLGLALPAGAAAPGGAMMSADTQDKPVFDMSGLGDRVRAFKSLQEGQALAQKGRVVLFFAASWCPTCRATFKDLQKNYAQIPADVTILVVNYDTAKALKSAYGVNYQHTFVQLGPEGKALRTWSGSKDLADILQRIR